MMMKDIKPETVEEREARLLAERKRQEEQTQKARRLRAQLDVLSGIKRYGVYWPGDQR